MEDYLLIKIYYLTHLYLNFENANWVFNNKKIKISNLSSIASLVSDEVFHATPIIQNELVVRDKLSAMSMGGATNLIQKIFNSSHLKNLRYGGSSIRIWYLFIIN